MNKGSPNRKIFNPFRFTRCSSLGLDLGNFSVKLACVAKKGFSKTKVLSYSIMPIGQDSTRDAQLKALVEARKMLASADTDKVNISVCGPNVVVRYIILPLMQERDLNKSFDIELERYIPFKTQDAIVDYRILTKLSNNQMIVLLVAAQETFIRERVDFVREAGLEPQMVNVDAFALMEAFRSSLIPANRVSAILDIGWRFSKLVVFEGDVPYFSRDIAVGEYEILQNVSERLGSDMDKARETAYNATEENLKIMQESINTSFGALLNELSLSFEYCERDLEKKVDELYITGGGSRIKIVQDLLKAIPDLKVNIWNPAQGFQINQPAAGAAPKDMASVLAVAVGLAIS